jgi:hypothetical protein
MAFPIPLAPLCVLEAGPLNPLSIRFVLVIQETWAKLATDSYEFFTTRVTVLDMSEPMPERRCSRLARSGG